MSQKSDGHNPFLNIEQRLKGLDHIASLRCELWQCDINSELKSFFREMRRIGGDNYQHNLRVLNALYFLAGIHKSRHALNFDELTVDEKNALVNAMNHLRVVVSLFPRKLSYLN